MSYRPGKIPAKLTEKDFNKFVLLLLTTGSRGPKSKYRSLIYLTTFLSYAHRVSVVYVAN